MMSGRPGRTPLLRPVLNSVLAFVSVLALAACGSDSGKTESNEEVPVRDAASLPPRATPAEGGVVSNADSYYVVCTMEPDPVPLNEPFGLTVHVYEPDRLHHASDITLEVDGRMPDHRHGMNRTPSVRSNADGSFTIEGMLFHMPGFWELHLDVTRGGMTERAQLDVNLD